MRRLSWRRVGITVSALSLIAVSGFSEDWPHFLGATYDLHSAEKGVFLDFPESGPQLLWEAERGSGHAGPVVVGEKLVFLHQVEDREQIRCLDAESGEKLWEYSYPVVTEQAYGVVDAPRSSPVIDPATDLVFTLGNDGDLLCLRLADGSLVWRLSLAETFGESPMFFGYGSCPFVYKETLIVHVGAQGACVVALDKQTGELVWKSAHEWGGSYASPVIGTIHGQEKLLVYAGGKGKPPVGGLLCMDPASGKIDSEFPWRPGGYTSVIGASPVVCGEDRVFITEDYGRGGAMVEFSADFQARLAWTSPELGCQFQTPIYHQGVLYGIGGNGGLMLAYDVRTGRVLWNEHYYMTQIEWQGRPVSVSLGHGHLVQVGDSFLCQGEDGVLMHLKLGADGYEIQAKARLFFAPEAWAPPVISGGRLYVMQNEFGPRLLCYDLRRSTSDTGSMRKSGTDEKGMDLDALLRENAKTPRR